MLKLFENLCRVLEAGENGMLAATVEAKGSSPRSAGAYMLVTARGRVYGTIGGGNLEYQATRRAQALLERTENALEAYDLSNDTAAGLGMICGWIYDPRRADEGAVPLFPGGLPGGSGICPEGAGTGNGAADVLDASASGSGKTPNSPESERRETAVRLCGAGRALLCRAVSL